MCHGHFKGPCHVNSDKMYVVRPLPPLPSILHMSLGKADPQVVYQVTPFATLLESAGAPRCLCLHS